MLFFFFFSSRRRHTRFDCDWSSDVCSSDLAGCSSSPPSVAPARWASRTRSGPSRPASAATWSCSTCASRTSTPRPAIPCRWWCTPRAPATCAMCSWVASRWCSATSSSPRRSKSSCGRPIAARPSCSARSALQVRPDRSLGVCFNEPQPLVGAARDLRAYIRRAHVAQIRRLVDGPAHPLPEVGQRRRQGPDVLLARRDREGILRQLRALGHDPRGSLGRTAELNDALREQVHVLLHCFVDLVEQLVQGDEVRALDVPVRLLRLRLEVDRLRQPVVEQIAHLAAHILGQVVHGFVSHGATPLCDGLIEGLSR